MKIYYSVVWNSMYVRINLLDTDNQRIIDFLLPINKWGKLRKALETEYTVEEY